MMDYECYEGEWRPRELVEWELMIPEDDGTEKPIYSLSPHENREALGVTDCLAGGSAEQLKTIKTKVGEWINRMKMGTSQQRGMGHLQISTLAKHKVWHRHHDK